MDACGSFYYLKYQYQTFLMKMKQCTYVLVITLLSYMQQFTYSYVCTYIKSLLCAFNKV